jgi:hypothetical protein
VEARCWGRCTPSFRDVVMGALWKLGAAGRRHCGSLVQALGGTVEAGCCRMVGACSAVAGRVTRSLDQEPLEFLETFNGLISQSRLAARHGPNVRIGTGLRRPGAVPEIRCSRLARPPATFRACCAHLILKYARSVPRPKASRGERRETQGPSGSFDDRTCYDLRECGCAGDHKDEI